MLLWGIGGIGCFTPNVAAALPEGRVAEMVSPLYKGGYGTRGGVVAMAPDGERVAFMSIGAFAGAPSHAAYSGYLSRRGGSGWLTVSLLPPASIAPLLTLGAPIDFSEDLVSSLSLTILSPYGDGGGEGGASQAGIQAEFLLHSSDASDVPSGFSVACGPLETLQKQHFNPGYLGASGDLSHIVFRTDKENPLLEAANKGGEGGNELYDLMDSSGAGASCLRLVAVNDAGEEIDPYCPVLLGNEGSGIGSEFNAVAAGGREIFFTTNVVRTSAHGGECDLTRPSETHPNNPALVFARMDGQNTLLVSAPVSGLCVESAPCHSASPARAEFQGANEQGTRVFFTTVQPLVSGDVDGGTDLYMAVIGCPGGEGEACEPAARRVTGMVQVSHDGNVNEAADVQGVVAISPDGSRVYFVARGVLSEGSNVEGVAPVAGADNLYVYDTTSGGPPVFVADLCSGPRLSGVVRDGRCATTLGGGEGENDSLLWIRPESAKAQTAGAGRFLLFSSYGRLLANDTDTTADVYRYDAVTGRLDRVSGGEGGYDANGNDSMFNAELPLLVEDPSGSSGAAVYRQHEMSSRAISEDGTRVLFTSASRLSPRALDGLANVYEWHKEEGSSEGVVSMVSTGSSGLPEEEAVISPSGRDVFFQTSSGLVAQDLDGATDIYDMRLGGGFPEPPAPRQPCSSDACQGPLSSPAPLLIPGGSASQPAGENLPVPKPKARAKAKKAKHKSKSARGKQRGRKANRALRSRAGDRTRGRGGR